MYKLNEVKKRLEPIETLCQYCETEHSEDMEDNFFIPLFKEKDRTNIVVYRSVKFSKIPVGIPRCKTCKEVHERARTKALLYAWGFCIFFMIFVFAKWGPLGILAIIASIFIGFLGSHLLEKMFVSQKEIYTLREGAKKNEAVQELVLNGWSLNQPMA